MTDEEFKSVPSITLDDEDIADRHGRRVAAPADPAPGRHAPVSGVSAGRTPRRAFLVFAAVGLAAAVSLVWLYSLVRSANTRLASAELKIQQLEARLASTDTSITQSEVLLAEKLKSMDQSLEVNKGEIRKLWGLAGDTQRKAIEQLKVTNDQQGASLKQLQQQMVAAEQKALDQQTVIDQMTVTTRNNEAAAREAVQRMELAQEKITVLDGDLKSIKQKQTQQETDYGKRLTVLEDTSKSTDVFRRNTQEDLRKLRDELLRQSATPPKSSP